MLLRKICLLSNSAITLPSFVSLSQVLDLWDSCDTDNAFLYYAAPLEGSEADLWKSKFNNNQKITIFNLLMDHIATPALSVSN